MGQNISPTALPTAHRGEPWVGLQSMDDTRNVTQYRQEDIDKEVGIATWFMP